MPEWFIDQWPYYIAVLVATVLTVLVLRVTFLRLRELHLEIERLQLKNEQLSRKLEEEGVTVFRPALQVTRFGLLGNLLPVLTLAVLVLVVVYSNIRGMRARIKHSEQMEEYFNRWENAFRVQTDTFRGEIESFKKSVERREAAFRDEIRMFRIQLATVRQPESSDSNEATRSRDIQIIEKKVIEIVSEQMGADKAEIKRETSFFKDLNADSLDAVELVITFEKEFNISIPDEEAEKIQTVGAAIDYIFKSVHYKILKEVQEVLVDALGIDDDEVTAEATLMGDLGAESIDFVDIVLRLEKMFGIKIPQGELFPDENLVNDSEYVYNGKFTEKGLAKLREKMWHTDVTAFERDPDIKKLGDLFTVGSIVNYIMTKRYVQASPLQQ